MSIWKYADRWQAPSREIAVTMGEGQTPLIRSTQLGPELGLKNLWFKYEGGNPTGSYKDRFAAAAVTHLRQDEKQLCLGTSSGNTGAAVAAYCARAGIACYLAIVEGAPDGKLRQMRAYGAHLYRVKDFGKSPEVNNAVMTGLRELAQELDAGFEVSAFALSPRGMAGVKTIGYEIAEALADGALKSQDPDALTTGVRIALSRTIYEQINGLAPELEVLSLEPRLEQMLQDAVRGKQQSMGLEPGLAEQMLQQINEGVIQMENQGKPAVLLVASTIRLSLIHI